MSLHDHAATFIMLTRKLQCMANLQGDELPETSRTAIVAHMVTVHQSVCAASRRFQEQLRRYNYVTPKNYLDFIHNYK